MLVTLFLAGLLAFALTFSRREPVRPTSTEGEAAGRAPDRAPQTPNAPDPFSHDAGQVLEGERINHLFEYANASGQVLEVDPTRDVTADCGCSELTVSRHRLAPGDRASIRVGLNTAGQPGRFAHGGTVTWRSPDGAAHPVRVTLSGEAVTAVRCWPDVVSFSPGDVEAGVVKDVTLSARYPIDWGQVTLRVSDPDVFEVRRLGETDRGPRYAVRCTLPPSAETAATVCRVSGRLASTSPVAPGSPFSVTLPIRAQQSVELAAQPRTLLLQSSPAPTEPRRYTTRVLLQGRAVEGTADPIQSVTAARHRVEWRTQRAAGGRTAVVEISLTADAADAPFPETVTVVSHRGSRLELRAVRVGVSESSPKGGGS